MKTQHSQSYATLGNLHIEDSTGLMAQVAMHVKQGVYDLSVCVTEQDKLNYRFEYKELSKLNASQIKVIIAKTKAIVASR